MNVKIVDGCDYPEEVRALFSEYTDMLIANDAEFKKYLAVQNYDEEIAHLKSKYGLPAGRLYVLFADGKSSGCISGYGIFNMKLSGGECRGNGAAHAAVLYRKLWEYSKN